MKKKSMKTLTAVLACSMVLGAVPPVEGVSGIPVFTMSAEAAAPKKLTITASGKTVYAGKSIKLGVKATKGAKVTYKSSNKSVAAINAKGLLTGRKAGTARITITAKKAKYKTVKKTVKVKVVRQNQKITASNKTVTVGNTVKLGAKGKTTLSYKSSNNKIATVNSKGVVTAKKAGTVKITITAAATGIYNKSSRTIIIKVNPKPDTEPKQTEAQKETEKTKQTEASKETEIPKQTEDPKETETPSQPETPKPGISYVTNVYFAETYKSNILYVGDSKKSTLKWEATGNTTLKDFVFKSSDPSIATVDKNGTITGINPGTVRITATSKTPFSPLGSAPEDYFSATQKYQIKARTSPIDSIAYPVITGGEAVTEKIF